MSEPPRMGVVAALGFIVLERPARPNLWCAIPRKPTLRFSRIRVLGVRKDYGTPANTKSNDS